MENTKLQLIMNQPRDDYRELLELTIIYLGGRPSRGMHFMQLGALHRARWMARVIYAIKIRLFCSQFVRKKGEVANWSASSDILPLPLAYMFVHGLLLMSQFRPQPTTLNLSSA